MAKHKHKPQQSAPKTPQRPMPPGRGDTVPAMLTPGEYVLNPEATKMVGKPKLDQLNDKGLEARQVGGLKGFANGGPVKNDYSPSTAGLQGMANSKGIDNGYVRDDLTAKGNGFYGNINGTPGAKSPAVTELSIGVSVPDNYEHIPGLNPRVAPLQLDGHQQYYDAPSVVPGMNSEQLGQIRNGQVSDSVYQNATDSAINRQFQGKQPFAGSLEQVQPYPKGYTLEGYCMGGPVRGYALGGPVSLSGEAEEFAKNQGLLDANGQVKNGDKAVKLMKQFEASLGGPMVAEGKSQPQGKPKFDSWSEANDAQAKGFNTDWHSGNDHYGAGEYHDYLDDNKGLPNVGYSMGGMVRGYDLGGPVKPETLQEKLNNPQYQANAAEQAGGLRAQINQPSPLQTKLNSPDIQARAAQQAADMPRMSAESVPQKPAGLSAVRPPFNEDVAQRAASNLNYSASRGVDPVQGNLTNPAERASKFLDYSASRNGAPIVERGAAPELGTARNPIVNDTTLKTAQPAPAAEVAPKGLRGFAGKVMDGLSSAGALQTQLAGQALQNPMIAGQINGALNKRGMKSLIPDPNQPVTAQGGLGQFADKAWDKIGEYASKGWNALDAVPGVKPSQPQNNPDYQQAKGIMALRDAEAKGQYSTTNMGNGREVLTLNPGHQDPQGQGGYRANTAKTQKEFNSGEEARAFLGSPEGQALSQTDNQAWSQLMNQAMPRELHQGDRQPGGLAGMSQQPGQFESYEDWGKRHGVPEPQIFVDENGKANFVNQGLHEKAFDAYMNEMGGGKHKLTPHDQLEREKFEYEKSGKGKGNSQYEYVTGDENNKFKITGEDARKAMEDNKRNAVLKQKSQQIVNDLGSKWFLDDGEKALLSKARALLESSGIEGLQ